MEGPDYEKILNTAPEILHTSKPLDESLTARITTIANKIICVSSAIMSLSAFVAKTINRR